jgi:hypothetical protein
MSLSYGPVINHTYTVIYECRDIGYGVETGDAMAIYRGFTDAGTHTFQPVDGSPVIYLFSDEITGLF